VLEVGATTVPRLEVYNKVDRITVDEQRRLRDADPSALLISAATGKGCDELLETVAARLALDQQRLYISLDLSEPGHMERLGWIYRHGRVHSQTTAGDKVEIEADLPRRLAAQVTARPAAVTARKARHA
jgi:GTP-binding protein HflX